MGGLPRRTTILEGLRSDGELLVIDAGGSLSAKDLTNLGAGRTKAELMAKTYAFGGIDAMALSARDWQLGRDFLMALKADHELPLLAANLECAEARPLPGGRVVERGGLKIGLVGVTDGIVAGCSVTEPRPAAEAAFTALGDVDLRILLTPHPRGQVTDLDDVADLVLMTTSAARLSLGRSLPIGVVGRGKSMGVVSITGEETDSGLWSSMQEAALKDEIARYTRDVGAARERAKTAPDAERAREDKRLAFSEEREAKAKKALAAYGTGEGARQATLRMVELSDEVADHPEVAAWVQATLGTLESAGGLPIPDDAPRITSNSRYLGSDGCQGCHPTQHAQWSGTRHATAWATLRDDQHGRDPACVGCHVTGWQADSGPSEVEAISAFRGVQCEACHGPSAAHARRPSSHKPVRDPDLAVCTQCHDGERDGGRFEPATYRAKVVHTSGHEASPEVSPEASPPAP